MTVTTPETATIEHLDWEPACNSASCKHGHPPATHSVQWNFPCTCRDDRTLACAPCAVRIDEANELGPWGGRCGWICGFCDARVSYPGTPKIVTVRPLP